MIGLAVADTTVLSNFAYVRHPRWIVEAFPSVGSPEAVMDEIDRGRALGYLPALDWSWLPVLHLSAKEERRARELEARLGRGESACLAISEARGALLLTDDRAARRLAASLSIRCSGTLGVLVTQVEQGRTSPSEADRILHRMIEAGYRCPVESVSELL
jgi:predicted nucleic acid-binding protein